MRFGDTLAFLSPYRVYSFSLRNRLRQQTLGAKILACKPLLEWSGEEKFAIDMILRETHLRVLSQEALCHDRCLQQHIRIKSFPSIPQLNIPSTDSSMPSFVFLPRRFEIESQNGSGNIYMAVSHFKNQILLTCHNMAFVVSR